MYVAKSAKDVRLKKHKHFAYSSWFFSLYGDVLPDRVCFTAFWIIPINEPPVELSSSYFFWQRTCMLLFLLHRVVRRAGRESQWWATFSYIFTNHENMIKNIDTRIQGNQCKISNPVLQNKGQGRRMKIKNHSRLLWKENPKCFISGEKHE